MKLTINKKELEFSFGLGFLGELLDETGQSLEDVLEGFEKNPYKFIPVAMFVSTRYAYKRKGKDIDFDRYQMLDWIEEDGGLTDKNESAIKFMSALSESLFKDVPTEKSTKTSKGSKKK